MVSRFTKVFVFSAFFATLLFYGFGCATLDPALLQKRPSAKLKDVSIKAITFDDITFQFDVQIHNPYPLGLKLKEVAMDVFVEGHQFMQSKTGQGLQIRANGSEVNSLDLALKYKDLQKTVRAYQRKSYLKTVIKGKIVIDLPNIGPLPDTWPVAFKVQKKIPALKPQIRIRNFKVKMPSRKEIRQSLVKAKKNITKTENVVGFFGDLLAGRKDKAKERINPRELDIKIKVSFAIELRNRTRASLSFRKLGYNFAIENEPLVQGTTNRVRKYRNKLLLYVNNEFSSRSLSKSVIKAFRRGKANYRLKGGTELILPKSISSKPVPLKIDEGGTFRF